MNPTQRKQEEQEDEVEELEVQQLVERCKPSLQDEMRLLQASACSQHSSEVTEEDIDEIETGSMLNRQWKIISISAG